MDKMSIYNSLCTPPNDALKPIGFGNLKGKSDINPQWRYEAITNQFGPCGTGWKYTIDSHWIQPVQQTGEVMVYVMISFYYKDGDKWSEPIPAYGGDYLVKKDKNGIHGNDEAMKMADDTKDADTDQYKQQTNGSNSSQNRPQATQKQNANNYKGSTANNATDEMRAKAIKSLNAEIERTGVASTEVAAIAKAKYGKASVKEMSTGQICDLTNKLESYLMEQINEASA